jgi:hypothetical protein
MAVFYAPIEGILAQMQAGSSTPEGAARRCRQVNRGASVTVILFLLPASIGFVGQAKPF